MLLTKIKMYEGVFTKTDKKIADYILFDAAFVRSTTSHEFAKLLDIGQSNIIRFAQKLGYSGFRELQIDIDIDKSTTLDDIKEDDSTKSTNEKIISQYIEIVKFTNSLNSDIEIDHAVDLVSSAKNIIVYGVGNSSLFAQYFSNHLHKMGFNSFSTTNSHISFVTISNYSKNDLAILISETGETREIIKAATLAKENEIPIIAISRDSSSHLSEMSTIHLKTSNDLSGTRLNAMTIRCSQLCIIDMLCLNTLKKDYSKLKRKLQTAEELLNNN